MRQSQSTENNSLIGQTFGRLVVVELYTELNIATKCLVKCACGNLKTCLLTHVKNGRTKSCGCLSREVTSIRNTTHAKTHTPVYNSWLSLRSRCCYSKNNRFSSYAQRGVTVCPEWKDSFENFYADMGDPPTSKHSIDRIDNNGNYCKENCRWATSSEQAGNRRSTVYVQLGTDKMCLKHACDMYGINYKNLHNQMRNTGETPEHIFARYLARYKGVTI